MQTLAALRRALSNPRLPALAGVAVACWLVAPSLLVLVLGAFRVPATALPFAAGTGWGLDNLAGLYAGSGLWGTLADTALFTAGSVALGTTIAVTLAWLTERTDLPGRSLVLPTLLVPLLTPPVAQTIGWVLLAGERTGLVNVLWRAALPWPTSTGPFDIFTMGGMVFVQGMGLVTLLYLFARAALRNVDPALEEAARVGGASGWQVALRVSLPAVRPHLLGAMALAAVLTVEAFEVPLLLALGAGADIFSTRIYYALADAAGGQTAYGTVAALGLHVLALTGLLVWAFARLTRQGARFATLRAGGHPPAPLALGHWRWPAAGLVGGWLALTSLAPLIVLAWTSLLPQYLPPGRDALALVSLDQYRGLFDDARLPGALLNTVVLALAAPTLAVGVALVLAWAVRMRVVGRRVGAGVDALASSSVALPAVLAANGLLVFYLWLPPIAPLAVLVLAYAYRLAVAYRVQAAGLGQLDPALGDAALVAGAGPLRALRSVLAPLAAPSTLAAWALLAVVTVRELTLPLVLTREGEPLVVSTLVWRLWGNHTGEAAALGLLGAVGVLGLLTLVGLAARRVQR
ncbi:MAG: ABC transporter permease subunit [Chloroflexota bacterium]